MKYPWIDEYLLAKPSVTKDLQAEWNGIRYQIGGKLFAAICLDDATGKAVTLPSNSTRQKGSSCADSMRTSFRATT